MFIVYVCVSVYVQVINENKSNWTDYEKKYLKHLFIFYPIKTDKIIKNLEKKTFLLQLIGKFDH